MKILVTGGCGFIGSNFVLSMLSWYRECSIVTMDALTYAGNPDNLLSVEKDPRNTFVKANICDQDACAVLFAKHDFDAVVHFAAESHVDRSIQGPAAFVLTNVLGTQTLLETAMRAWEKRFDTKRFIHISTDEVYGTLGSSGSFSETTPLAPNSPYSASKAGSDLIARAYFETFGFPVIITRCSNNYGPYQFPEKLIPLMITSAMADIPLPVYGDGLNIRDWLHVGDHCRAIDMVLRKGKTGQVYNIGGSNERRNIDIVKFILKELGKPESLIEFVKDRPGHDRRYAIDAGKIKRELGWSPAVDFDDGIRMTIKWYRENKWWWEKLLNAEKNTL